MCHVAVSELFRQLLWVTLGTWVVYPLIWILSGAALPGGGLFG